MGERSTKRTERLQVMLSEAELQALEDWRFAHRMPTLAAAVRELLSRGMATTASEPPSRPAEGRQQPRGRTDL